MADFAEAVRLAVEAFADCRAAIVEFIEAFEEGRH